MKSEFHSEPVNLTPALSQEEGDIICFRRLIILRNKYSFPSLRNTLFFQMKKSSLICFAITLSIFLSGCKKSMWWFSWKWLYSWTSRFICWKFWSTLKHSRWAGLGRYWKRIFKRSRKRSRAYWACWCVDHGFSRMVVGYACHVKRVDWSRVGLWFCLWWG